GDANGAGLPLRQDSALARDSGRAPDGYLSPLDADRDPGDHGGPAVTGRARRVRRGRTAHRHPDRRSQSRRTRLPATRHGLRRSEQLGPPLPAAAAVTSVKRLETPERHTRTVDPLL